MKSQKKIVIVIILGILILAFSFIGLYMKNSAPVKDEGNITVRYAAPLTIAAAPVYVADAKGFWGEEGINMEVTYFDSGRKALDALLSNNAEVMSVSETPPLRAYLAGSKINIVATVAEHREAKMTVRTDRITTPGDVKGKKIGTVAGTNSDYYMYRWLESHNIKTSDVQIIQLDAAALSQTFVQGGIDAMFAWEPYNYNASSKISDLAQSWPTELYSGRHTIVMNSSYLQSNGPVAEQVIKGFIRAEEYIKNNPEDAKKIVIEKTGISEEALNGLWSEYIYKLELDNEILDIVNDEATWIKSSPGNSSSMNPSQLISPAPLLNVDRNLVGGRFKS